MAVIWQTFSISLYENRHIVIPISLEVIHQETSKFSNTPSVKVVGRQEINIWAPRVEIWCATGVCSGPHSIHHLHHTTGPTHQEAWSDFPPICRRYPALFSIQTLRAFIHCQQHFSPWKVRCWYPGVDEVEFIEIERRQDGTIGHNIST